MIRWLPVTVVIWKGVVGTTGWQTEWTTTHSSALETTTHEIPPMLQKPNVHHRVRKSPPFFSILSHINPVHALLFSFFMIITIYSRLHMCLPRLVSSCCHTKNSKSISLLTLRVPYASRSSSPSPDHVILLQLFGVKFITFVGSPSLFPSQF